MDSKKNIIAVLVLFLSLAGCKQIEPGDNGNNNSNNNPTSNGGGGVPTPNGGGQIATQFVFSTNEQIIYANQCSNKVLVKTLATDFAQAPVAMDTILNLSGDSNLTFYSDASCTISIQSLTIFSGTSSNGFYFKSKSQGDYSINATSTNIGSFTQNQSIIIGTATKLAITSQPLVSTYPVGNTLGDYVVKVEDQFGNVISNSSAGISVSLALSGVTISGITSLNAINGVATFSGLKIPKSGTYSLLFTSSPLANATSQVVINPGNVSVLYFTNTPSFGVSNKVFSSQPVIQTQDSQVDFVPVSGAIALSAYSDSNCSNIISGLSGESGSLVNGTSNFTSVEYTGPVTPIYLKATYSGFSQCSSPIPIITQLSTSKNIIQLDSSQNYDIGSLISGGKAPYSYSIKTSSIIGSSINQIGLFSAGINTGFSNIVETVKVTDLAGQSVLLNVTTYPVISVSGYASSLVGGNSTQLSVVGGQGPYLYSIQSGSGAISTTGQFSASISQSGTSVVKITDTLGTAVNVSIQILEPLHITPSSSSILVNSTYQFVAVGGTGPYAFTMGSGSGDITESGFFTSPTNSGPVSIVVTDSVNATATLNFNVLGSPANQLSFLTDPSDGKSGISLSTLPAIQALNIDGEVDTGFAKPAVLAIYDETCTTPVSGTNILSFAPSVFSQGILNLTSLIINDPGTYTLKVMSNNFSKCSASFIVTDSTATSLAITQQPVGDIIASNLITLPIVQALDSNDEISSLYNKPVNVKIFDSKCAVESSGVTLTVVGSSFDSGTFSPTQVLVSRAGSYTLQFTSGTFSVCSNPFTVSGLSSQIVLGNNNSCLIKSGSMKCWGDNASGQLGVNPTTLTFRASPSPIPGLSSTVNSVTLGGSHICADDNGTLKCWGLNSSGELNLPIDNVNNNIKFTPTLTGLSEPFLNLSSGLDFSCGMISGQFECWGSDTMHQLGRGSPAGSALSCGIIADLTTCEMVGCKKSADICSTFGDSASCASNGCSWDGVSTCSTTNNVCAGTTSQTCETIDNLADCQNSACNWDTESLSCYSSSANNGIGNTSAAVKGGLISINTSSSNNQTTCAISNDHLFCWGDNSHNQCGTSNLRVDAPKEIKILSNPVASVGVGFDHTCSVMSNQVYCWGSNSEGQLGSPVSSDSATPQIVSDLSSMVIQKVVSGYHFSCALTSTGTVYCWGRNAEGQLGQGNLNSTNSVVQLTTLTSVYDIEAGNEHACALMLDGTLKCWGNNSLGQTGVPSPQIIQSPTAVTGF
jgi:alpha-tubulin suppressor-like RCC1 family protein